MRTWLTMIAVSLAMAAAAMAGERAGAMAWQKGLAGITVKFAPPMSNTNYSVLVGATHAAGYSPTSECTYFNVLNEALDSFQVQHKTCKDGRPIPIDDPLTLQFIIVTRPE